MLIKIKNKIGARGRLTCFIRKRELQSSVIYRSILWLHWWFDGLFCGEGLGGCCMPGYLDLT